MQGYVNETAKVLHCRFVMLTTLKVRTVIYDGDADYILNYQGVEAMVGYQMSCEDRLDILLGGCIANAV